VSDDHRHNGDRSAGGEPNGIPDATVPAEAGVTLPPVDRLAPARGIAKASLLGLLFWVILLVILYWLFR
jgi:hypothetical protein